MKNIIAATLSVVVLAGCAHRGADYTPLVDMKSHDSTKFALDTTECQAYARQRISGAQGAVAGALLGALLGAAIAPRGYRNSLAARGAGVGAVSGGVGASSTQESITKQCLAGRGYNVLN